MFSEEKYNISRWLTSCLRILLASEVADSNRIGSVMAGIDCPLSPYINLNINLANMVYSRKNTSPTILKNGDPRFLLAESLCLERLDDLLCEGFLLLLSWFEVNALVSVIAWNLPSCFAINLFISCFVFVECVRSNRKQMRVGIQLMQVFIRCKLHLI